MKTDPALIKTAQLMSLGVGLVEHLADRGQHMIWANKLNRKFPKKSVQLPTLRRFIETYASYRNIPAADLRQIIELFGDDIGEIELNNGQSQHERLEDLLSFRDVTTTGDV